MFRHQTFRYLFLVFTRIWNNWKLPLLPGEGWPASAGDRGGVFLSTPPIQMFYYSANTYRAAVTVLQKD